MDGSGGDIIISTLRTIQGSYLSLMGKGSAIIIVADANSEDGYSGLPGEAGGPFSKKEYQPLLESGQLIQSDCDGLYELNRGTGAEPLLK